MILAFLIIAIFQGVVFGLIVLKSPLFKNEANRYLSYAFFSLSFSLLNFVLDNYTEIYKTAPLVRLIDILDSGIVFPAFIFLFILKKANSSVNNSRKFLYLVIPYFCTLTNSILEELTNSLKPLANVLDFLDFLILFVGTPALLIYAYTLIKFIDNNQEKKWVTRLWLLTFVLFISWVLVVFSGIIFENEVAPIAIIIPLFAVLLIHWTAYFGIYKYRLAKDQENIKALLNKQTPNTKNQIHVKANSITGTFTSENSYFKKLEDLFTNHQIYKDSTLDRNRVAEKLGISPGYVSQLVNAVTGENFSTYINQYRVEAVKKLLLNTDFDNYSLLAIGLECGFPSKSTFYNAFKKATDMTPNTYRKKHKKSEFIQIQDIDTRGL